ncbi:MAG: hypothetical protein Q4G03_12040, partial [Planctomycetia bacterium]|nr:hypothetical protein [Planctomycetia bacterium]
EAPKPAEPAPAPATPAEATKPAEPAPAEAPKPATVAPQPNAESDALARERGQANAEQFSVGQSGAYMTVIPMRRFPVGTAYTIISNTVPGVDVTMDATSPALIIYGPRYAVQGAIELATRLEKQLDTTFEYIQLEKELPAEVFSALPQIEPRVSSSYDRANNRLLLTGKLADVARLKEFVLQIQSEASDEKDGVYYLDVERELPGEIQDYIRRAVPGVELTFNSTDRRFTIIGAPTEQLATAKLITDAIANLPPDNITKYYRFDSYVPDRMIELIRERVRHINTIERDDHNANTLRIVARPYQHEEIAEAIEQIKAEYPFQDENTFVSYKTTREQRERFKAVQDDFTREHGSIKILQDDSTNSFAVWAFPAQHEALKKLLDELATVEPGDKEQATIYSPKYVDSATLISILNELVPNLRVVNDTKNLRLILRGTADDIKEAQDVLATLDMRDENAVERSYKSYPIRGFYSYDGVGSYYTPTYYVRDLSALVPAARVTYDYYNQAVVVWGTEEEHQIIGAAIADLIDKKDLDKRVLRWQIHRATYTTLTAQISAVYPGAIPSYDPSSKTLLVRTNNTVTLDAVRELLELLDPEEVSDFDPQLQYYDVGAAPSSDLLAAVRALVPNAQLVRIDVKNKQLLVIARPAEQKVVADNIANLTKTYGSSDLRLVPYPIYSMDVAALATSMTTAHPGATFEPDVRGGRLLVRATLEDHVIISQEIASINGEDDQEEEGEGQDDSENPKKSAVEPGPRVVVYDVPSGAIAVQARGVIANLFPEVQVYGGTQTTISSATPSNPGQKLAIIANNRTQKMIKQIIDSLTNKPSGELVFAVYPYGSVNADTVDALIGNLMPNAYAIPGPLSATEPAMVRAQRRATTMTSRRTLQNVVSPGNYNEPIPFYRVDERTQTVAVLASDDTHAKIRDVIEKLSSLTSDDAQATTKVFRLNDPIASQLVAAITSIYTATVPTGISAYELLVYGPASEVNKVEEFIKSVVEDNQFDKGRRHMRLFVLPEEAKYNRDRMVNIINSNFAVNGVSAYPGAVSNQVIVWGLDASLERVAKFIDEITSVPDESVFKTYPIVNTNVDSAAAFLARVCPNLELTPDPVRKQIVAFGTPLQHASIAAALEAFDTKQDPSVRMVVNTYNWDDVPSFWMVYTELHARFPNLLITPSGTDAYVVGAPEADQAKIAQYITARRNNLEEQSVRLETYYLHRINFTRLVQVVPAILPTVAIYPGKGANEVFVVASPLNQERFKRTLAQLESVPDDETEYGIEPKIYHVSPGAATTAVGLLSPMLPGVVMYPLSGERLVVWGGAADHKYVEHSLETIAEAFPVIELKKYPLRYLKLVDVIGFLQARYATEGQFFSSTSGDLMCIAPQVVQEKIAQLLSELDVEEAADTRFQPVAYDISNIPLASHALAVANILRIVPEAVQLPTSTPGYLVFYARPQQHAKIQALIDEMLKERPDLQQRLVAYSVRRMTLAQLSALLLPMYPNVKVGAGVDANQIIILAKPEEHARISQLIQQLNLEHDDGMTARVYRLKNSQLDVGSLAIRTMYPHAIVVADNLSRSLLVKAYDDEQKKIEELVREIDDKDPERNTSFKVFNINGLDFTYLLAPLRNFYYGDPAFQIQYDTAHEAVLVRGTAIQHKAVEDLIKELRAGALADKDVYMQCYTLQGTQQASSALSMLYEIIWEQGRNFMIRRDWNTGSLLVLGRPEDHALVQHVLETLKPEETELAIFNLTYIDANTASQALSMIETDGSYVDARFDSNSNRLFVRSTAPKLEEIRLMLIKMGEKGLEKMSPFTSDGSKPAGSSGSRKFYPFGNDPNADAPTESVEPVAPAQASAKPTLEVTEGSGAIRTVTLSGADASEALAEALKGWSLDNQVNVVQGDGGVVQEKDEKETEPQQPKAEEPEVEEKQEETPQAALTHFDELLANLGRTLLPTRLSFSGLFTGALVLDDPTESAPVEQAPEATPTNEQETPNVQADAAKADAPQAQTATADDAQLPPNVYVVVNPDGSLLLSSSDEKALDELQRRLGLVVEQMQENHDQESQAVADDNDVSDVAPTNEDSASADPQSNQYLSYMTPENLEEARSRILLESSTYTVYQIKNISVSQMVPRLQTYLGERLNRNNYNYYQSTDYLLSSARSGIYMRTLTNAPPLSFQQDVSLNTLMVYGSKSDRLAVGAMIVVLDDADLFPQPITKPYKIRVENTSPNRMAQQVLSAFTLKFQTTLMPGNLSPRISPNMTTNTLEVYAPEELAKEIEEYVKEVDKEILEESVRKVRVVELKSVNSRVLTTYLQNLRTQQVQNRMLSTPYIGQAQMGPVAPMGGGYGRGMNAAAARNAARMMQTPGPYGPTF